MRVTTLQAEVGIREQEELDTIVRGLASRGYRPLIREMVHKAGELAEIDPEVVTPEVIASGQRLFGYRRSRNPVLGEVLLCDDAIVVLDPENPEALTVGCVGPSQNEKPLEGFCAAIEEVIRERIDGRRVRGMKFDWKPTTAQSSGPPGRDWIRRPFRAIPDEEYELTEPEYGEEDLRAAQLLVKREIRQFLIQLAQSGKLLSGDAGKVVKPEVIQSLIELDLIAEEYLLTCRKDQHTICTLPSKDHLAQDPLPSLKCSECDRSFAEEHLQVVYTRSERGEQLMRGSMWMYVWVTQLLRDAGVDREAIRWNVSANGEDLDILIDDFDARICLELKDREFGLGDAYPFTFRVQRFGGDHGMVVTMEKVSSDAKRFLDETSGRRDYPLHISCLEGRKDIEQGVRKLVADATQRQARVLSFRISQSVGLDVWPILNAWIKKRTAAVV